MHADQPSPSLAEQSLERIATDRVAWLSEVRERARHVARIVTSLDEAEAIGAGYDDVIAASIRAMAEPVFAAVADAAGTQARRDPAQLAIGSVPDEDVVASLSVYADGSGRVLLSDAVVSLLVHLVELNAIAPDPRTRAGWAVAYFRLQRTGSLRRSRAFRAAVEAATAALRYYVLHQRAFGLSAELAVLVPGDSEALDVLKLLSTQFVIAHEAAHFTLGHVAAQAGDPAVELAADRLALAVVAATLQDAVPAFATETAMLGARLALLAIELCERALFVRCPATHPPARTRWERLSAGDPKAAAAAAALTAAVAEAAAVAQDLMQRLPERHWAAGLAHPAIACDVHDADYYGILPHLDRVGSGDPDDPYAILDGAARSGLEPDLATGVVQAAREGVPAGLSTLGLSDATIARVCDPARGLSFWTLMNAIFSSPLLDSASTTTSRRLLALAAATLVSGVMQGVY